MTPWRLLLMILLCRSALAETAIVLEQKEAPLKITAYAATFEGETRENQIKHAVRYANSSEKKIVALSLGIVAFDTFNNFLGRFSGIAIKDLDPKAESGGSWVQTHYSAFLFKKYGTGVAYVSEIRFEDGTFWHADMDSILSQMRKFAATLEKDDLKEKAPK